MKCDVGSTEYWRDIKQARQEKGFGVRNLVEYIEGRMTHSEVQK